MCAGGGSGGGGQVGEAAAAANLSADWTGEHTFVDDLLDVWNGLYLDDLDNRLTGILRHFGFPLHIHIFLRLQSIILKF